MWDLMQSGVSSFSMVLYYVCGNCEPIKATIQRTRTWVVIKMMVITLPELSMQLLFQRNGMVVWIEDDPWVVS